MWTAVCLLLTWLDLCSIIVRFRVRCSFHKTPEKFKMSDSVVNYCFLTLLCLYAHFLHVKTDSIHIIWLRKLDIHFHYIYEIKNIVCVVWYKMKWCHCMGISSLVCLLLLYSWLTFFVYWHPSQNKYCKLTPAPVYGNLY